MNKINRHYYKTKYGEFIIGSYDNKLCMLDWKDRKRRDAIDKGISKELNAEFLEEDNAIIQKTKVQLDEYFTLERKIFDIPLLMVGTDFQKSVWNALLDIEYGTTSSYLELAKAIGNEKAVRAVANANGANAISIIIPCHRIIGTNGKLTGYAGGLATKEKLLTLEQGF